MPDQPTDRPSVAEIAALTRRLRDLSRPGKPRDRDEVQRFLDDKRALLDRISAADAAARAVENGADAERHVHGAVINQAPAALDGRPGPPPAWAPAAGSADTAQIREQARAVQAEQERRAQFVRWGCLTYADTDADDDGAEVWCRGSSDTSNGDAS